jgi:RhoGEF domain/PH domain
VDFLKIYSIYAANHEHAVKTVDEQMRSNKAFANICEDASKQPECRALDLSSFLIKPVQRLCKYPLLFRELLKETPEDHTDYANLVYCHEQLSQVADFVNERKRAAEDSVRLLWLRRRLVDLPKDFSIDLSGAQARSQRAKTGTADGFNMQLADRQYRRDGVLLVQKKGKDHFKTRHVILMSDVLIVAKPARLRKHIHYKFHRSIGGDVLVEENPEALPGSENAKLEFELLWISTQERFRMCARDAREKRLWMEAIRECVEAQPLTKLFEAMGTGGDSNNQASQDGDENRRSLSFG